MPWIRANPVTSVTPKRAFHSSNSLASTSRAMISRASRREAARVRVAGGVDDGRAVVDPPHGLGLAEEAVRLGILRRPRARSSTIYGVVPPGLVIEPELATRTTRAAGSS
jgi:hypothetical protein